MKHLAIKHDRRTTDAIIEALAEGGIEFVLGMPGGVTGGLWRALHGHPKIRAMQVREESIGSLMAESYGRIAGRPAVVMGQGEWIVGNAGQGYIEALLGCSPVVILTEMSDGAPLSHHGPYQSGTGDYGTWDARQALAGVAKRVMVSLDPAQAVQHTQLAIKHALSGEPGPVAVVYHSNSVRGSVGPASVPRIYPTQAYLPPRQHSVDADALASAVGAIRGASLPVIIAGNGVRVGRAQANLAALARGLDVPVATTASGKGVFPETDPLGVGVIGAYGWATANVLVSEADVVIAVGTKLGPSDTLQESSQLLDPERQVLVQIDVEPLNAGWTYPIDHVLIGDAGFVLDRLTEGCTTGPASRALTGADRVASVRSLHGQFDGPDATNDSMPIAPRRTIALLQETFPQDGVITCDAGENRLFMMQWYRTKESGDYLQPAAGGGMGYAVPAAMGAKLAHPKRVALAVCGDGGFAMSVHALMTAVQEGLPIGVLVLNNGALGWVLHGMGDKAVAANFAEFDHAGIARSLGCDGIRVSSAAELRTALMRLPEISKPLVIDVPTSLATSFKDVTFDMADLPAN